MGKLLRGLSKSSRFIVVDTKDIVEEIIKNQNIVDDVAADILAKIVGFTIMLGSTMKDFKNLTVRVDSDCYIKSVVVIFDEEKHIKAYLSLNPQAEDTSLASLRVIKDMGLKEPYTAISSIDYKTLMDDISMYFFQSEQIPTIISCACSFDKKENEENSKLSIKNSGAFMLQIMPGASEDFIKSMEEKAAAIRPVNQLLDGGMTLFNIADLLYDDMNSETKQLVESYEILALDEVKFHCNCEKDRFKRSLITLGKEELQNIFAEDGEIKASCHFCNKVYEFKEEDFKDLWEKK